MSTSRRDFLKLAGALAGGATLIAVEKALEQPDFVKNVVNSVKQGKALQDLKERVDSRLPQNEEKLSLGELINHKESWMDVCSGVEIYHVPENDSNIIFCDITNDVKVAELPFVRKDGVVSDAWGDEKLNIGTYSMVTFMKSHRIMRLPLPQHEISPSGNLSKNDIDLSYKYLMYANFKDNKGRNDTSSSMQNEPSGKRGGVVLTNDGKFLVTTPEEFNSLSGWGKMEYAWILASEVLVESLDEMKPKNILDKDLTTTKEYTNTIATFYDTDGKIHTFAISTLSLFDEANKTFGQESKELDIVQLASLVNQYGIKHGYQRFVMVVPDAIRARGLVTPLAYPVSEAEKITGEEMAGTNPFLGNYGINRHLYGDDYPVYRALDAGSESKPGLKSKNFSPEDPTFPKMFVVSK